MFSDTLFEYKRYFIDGAESELRAQHNTGRRVSFLDGQMIGNVRQDYKGVSARVRRGGLYGFSSKGDYTRRSVESVLKEASNNALFLEQHVSPTKGRLSPVPIGTVTREESVNDVEQSFYIELCRSMDAYIVAHCPNIISRRVSAFSDSVEKVITVSNGYDAHMVTPRSYISVMLTAESATGTPVDVMAAVGGFGTIDNHFVDLNEAKAKVDKLYEQLQQKCEGIYAKAGEATCILSGHMAGMLAHEAVGHTVEADLVQSGSVSAYLLGKQVASEKVSMVDYAHTVFGEPAPLPVYVDDEGVKAEDAVLIQDGILTEYMNNRQSADLYSMTPRGNARAWLFSDEPLIRMRNTAIVPGDDKLEDMIASVDDGYYLVDSGNGQADMTGEFMFGVTIGYEIKKGKLGRAILDTTISGVAFEMLKTVDMVSDELEWVSAGFCGKKQPMAVGLGGPHIRCRLTMGGKA
ncbi:MAG TPA: TldD/PmbA family protein [Clostridiaceae bacterium]|nr:TldD/PmbA family protein [Clostridiaceae bacterium]